MVDAREEGAKDDKAQEGLDLEEVRHVDELAEVGDLEPEELALREFVHVDVLVDDLEDARLEEIGERDDLYLLVVPEYLLEVLALRAEDDLVRLEDLVLPLDDQLEITELFFLEEVEVLLVFFLLRDVLVF